MLIKLYIYYNNVKIIKKMDKRNKIIFKRKILSIYKNK